MDAESFLDQVPNLPTMPKILQELITSLNDENASTALLADKIALDQTLTAKILRMANSPFYGNNRKAYTVKDAVIAIGFDAVRNLVLACSLSDTIKAPDGFDIKAFWRASFQQAAIAKHIARLAEIDAEMAFTCGMLHNIGEVILHLANPKGAVAIDEAVKRGGDRVTLEKKFIGVSYPEVGALLAQRWKFPDEIVRAIAEQDAPFKTSSRKPSAFAEILYLTCYIHDSHEKKWDRDLVLDGFPEDIADDLQLDQEVIFSQLNLEDLGHSFDQLAS